MTFKQEQYLISLLEGFHPHEREVLWPVLPESVGQWWSDTSRRAYVTHDDVQRTISLLQRARASMAEGYKLDNPTRLSPVPAIHPGSSHQVRTLEGDGREVSLWILSDEDREAIRQLPSS